MIQCLNVGDVPPQECTRDRAVYDVRHVLSYVLQPYQPTKTLKELEEDDYGTDWFSHTSFFSADHRLFSPESKQLIDDLIGELPPWWKEMFEEDDNGLSLEETKKFVIRKTKVDNQWTDHLLVNRNGSNPHKGSIRITETKHAGPRRFAFSVERHEKQWSKLHKCHIVPLYGYSYSFTPKWWQAM